MSLVAIKNIQELISQFDQQKIGPNEREIIQKMWSDGVAAYEDFESHGNLRKLQRWGD
jgi:hypothetical protein